MDSPRERIEFVARSAHRVGVLEALADAAALNRRDLRDRTGASSATIGRVLGDFEDRHWVARDDAGYRLTPLGEYVAAGYRDLVETMQTERHLRDVWQWLPREMPGFSVDLFADAVVSYPGRNYPYEPVQRVTELIEGTTSMRGFGTTVFKSINNETVCRNVLDGMRYEYVFAPDVLEATVSWNPERVAAAASCEHCRILLHESLPDENRCGLGVFDDRVGICCHDPVTGMLEAVVDTGAPEAIAWAEDVYETYRAEARPLDDAAKAEFFPSDVVA